MDVHAFKCSLLYITKCIQISTISKTLKIITYKTKLTPFFIYVSETLKNKSCCKDDAVNLKKMSGPHKRSGNDKTGIL